MKKVEIKFGDSGQIIIDIGDSEPITMAWSGDNSIGQLFGIKDEDFNRLKDYLREPTENDTSEDTYMQTKSETAGYKEPFKSDDNG